MNTTLATKVALLLGIIGTAAVFLIVLRLLDVTPPPQASVALDSASVVASKVATGAAASSTPAGSQTPNAVTAVANAYPHVHSTIGVDSPIEGTLTRGTSVAVIGRTADGVWLEIRYSNAASGLGWVSADLMTLSTPKSAIPVATPP